MLIGSRAIGRGEPVFVIAEAGVNHNGDLDLALRLVDAGADAGADAIKFQTFKAELVASRTAPKAPYQIRATGAAESQLDMIRKLELSADAHRRLQRRCVEHGIVFLSTPFDESSVDLLDGMGVPAFKIASGEITNWPLLRHAAAKRRPILLSTGMSFLGEVAEAVDVLRGAGCEQLALLHCVSNYPAEPADANLRTIAVMAQAFGVPVGFSDHTARSAVAVAAVALGACIIEKHLTLDHGLPGPDHRASLEPVEFRQLVQEIRMAEHALGNGIKRPTASELPVRAVARRSVAAAAAIPRGVLITDSMLTALRPEGGISPTERDRVVGRRATRQIASGEILSWSDIE